MIISTGVILGFLLGGRVTDSLGSLYVFLLCALLSALGFFYGLARVKNIVPHAKESENLEEPTGEEEGHWWHRIWSHMRRTVGLPFKKREPGARPLVLLLCLAFLLGVSREYGIEYTEYALEEHIVSFCDTLLTLVVKSSHPGVSLGLAGHPHGAVGNTCTPLGGRYPARLQGLQLMRNPLNFFRLTSGCSTMAASSWCCRCCRGS